MAIEKIGTFQRSRRRCPTTTGYRARLQAGSTERFLYLFIEVDDTHFDAEPNNVRPDADRFDRVNLALRRSQMGAKHIFSARTHQD